MEDRNIWKAKKTQRRGARDLNIAYAIIDFAQL